MCQEIVSIGLAVCVAEGKTFPSNLTTPDLSHGFSFYNKV